MLPIPKTYLGSLCELKTQNNDSLVKGNISAITHDYLEVTYPPDVKKMLVAETLVKINIFSEALGNKFLIGRVYIGSDSQVRLIEIVTLSAFEKREYFRINIFQHATMFKESVEENEIYTTTKMQYDVTIHNISLSGLYFLSSEFLKSGETVYIVLDLAKGKHVFESRVFRINHENPERTGYGCAFSKMPPRISDALYHYIHIKQIEYIQREKQK